MWSWSHLRYYPCHWMGMIKGKLQCQSRQTASKIRSEPRTSEHKQLYQTNSDNCYEEEHENSNGISISISSSGSSSSRSSSSNSNIICTIYITTKLSFALIWCYDNCAWVQHRMPWTILILLYWIVDNSQCNEQHAFKVPVN